MTLFIATFSTPLAIINPLEALPVFLELAGHDEDVSQFLLQPFANYNMAEGWYLTSSPRGAAGDRPTAGSSISG